MSCTLVSTLQLVLLRQRMSFSCRNTTATESWTALFEEPGEFLETLELLLDLKDCFLSRHDGRMVFRMEAPIFDDRPPERYTIGGIIRVETRI
ncbi:uncharacterized protein BDR25DRAFT_29091 [Lindgomyces ingoldianus]|uniref:Uncharacterized protein n=1 Tax=Lindgomyces ingoldianus TaxID=673940 RepID=A0ACB6QVF5_9PLEO|nr:uncharacterized protein BDR25DRAFT_29091 [Lindgomyces ingoldianus]KAF2471019.1 hypothetical protein BDR25DRAFT_29091 [Lindgomyces ingoldianus]